MAGVAKEVSSLAPVTQDRELPSIDLENSPTADTQY